MNDALNGLLALWEASPAPLRALAALAAGWVAALAARFLVSRLLLAARFDRLAERSGLSEFLRKGRVGYAPSRLGGAVAYWAALLLVFLEAAKILDEDIYLALAGRLSQALPNLAAGLLIVVVGYFVVSFISNFALTIALNSSFHGARALAKAIKWLGVVVVATMALEQLGLGRSIVEFIFESAIAAAALGAALAFGLGCKDIARDSAKRFLQNLRESERESRGPDLEG